MNNFISESATIGVDTHIGYFSVIEDNVRIGDRCMIGHNVIIHAGSVIGDGVRIDANSVIGKGPMRAKRSIFSDDKTLPPAKIGIGCLIGAQVVVYCGCGLSETSTIKIETKPFSASQSLHFRTGNKRPATVGISCTQHFYQPFLSQNHLLGIFQ